MQPMRPFVWEGHGLRLILVPRHPERAAEVAREALEHVSSVKLLSECSGGEPWDILVVDRIGVLFHLYPRAQGAFIGGEPGAQGGAENLLEPAAWGVPIQHGPHMEDFAPLARDLKERGCSREISSAEDLAREWWGCLRNPRRGEEAKRGTAYVESLDGAARKAWEEIRGYL